MFKLTLLTPERKVVYEQEVDKLIVPGFGGEMDVLPGHSPLVTSLEAGIIRWRLKGESKDHQAVVSWGYCEIHPGGVDVLIDQIDFKEDIKKELSEKTISEGETKLMNEILDDNDWKQTARNVNRGRAQLQLMENK